MSKAWVVDLWLKATAPAAVLRLLNAAKNPSRIASKIPDAWKKAKFGQGARWLVQWRETVDGVDRLRSRSFDKKKDADAYATAISDDQYSGRYINVEDLNRTFKSAALEWRSSQHSITESSGKHYDDVLRRYIYPRWENVRLSAIDETGINDWIQQLKTAKAPFAFAEGVEKKPSAPSMSYLNQIVNVTFGGIMRYTLKRGWIKINPMADIHVPRRDNDPEHQEELKVFLTYREVEALAEAASTIGSKRDATMVRFMAYVGTRPGETYALRVGDLHFDSKRVVVSRSLTKDSKGNWKVGGTKTKTTRRVALPDFLIPELQELTKGRAADAYVFPAQGGVSFIRPQNWRSRVFNSAVKAAKLEGKKGLRPHSLRHTFASLSIAAGCDVRTLAAALGHTDVKMTLNEYAGLWPDRLDEVAKVLGNRRTAALMLSNAVSEDSQKE